MDSAYPLLHQLDDSLSLAEVGKNPDLTLEVQQLLKQGGFLLGAADGKLGIETIAAFKKFKQAAYLQYPDRLGASTAAALLELSDQGKHPTPAEAPKIPQSTPQGKSFRLPGGEVVYCDQLIGGSRFFTWGEATKNGYRIPRDVEIVGRIVATAAYMDMVRSLFGDRPLIVTSWFRPPDINRQQGGVSNSQHLLGDAVDFLVQGVPPLDVYRRLNNWHGARGGLGRSSAFTHLDRRGYCARWSYS